MIQYGGTHIPPSNPTYNPTMRRFPFIFCLLSVLIGLRTLNAMATVDPSTDAAADRICLTRPSVCGLK